MAATLQVLSGGRFILGIGAGWREDEYAAYGYDFPSPKVRFAQLEEVITICRLMWTEAEPSFEGAHFRIDGASAPPLPDPGAAHLHRRVRRADRAADGGPPGRHVERPLRQRRRLATPAGHRARGRGEGRARPGRHRGHHHGGAALPETDADSEQLVELLGHMADRSACSTS
jgi:alkanesulfonate monooxygenase SsuD/methylene tetrahydromethanopterin reductase-like flavin-dependent oxidoreductase (luciferase family)